MRLTFAVLLAALALPAPAHAWGFDAHKFITEQVIALLPPELKPLFESRRAFVVERSVDPDLWRTVGWEAEPPNHFVDLDFFGKYPFTELPREYDRAIEKYGPTVIHEQGTLPWRTQEFFGRLQRAFESLKRPNPGYANDDILLFSAILAHYIGDGHVPLHSVVNYDGQLTNQRGVHGRWESELFERTRASLKIAPAAPAPVSDVRSFMFDVLLASNRLAEGVLAADARAAAGREFYDDGYFEAFAKEQASVLQQRVNDSITAVASVIVGAWQNAGRPSVPLNRPRQPRRIPALPPAVQPPAQR
jgi:hypothetical protein